MTTAQTAEHLGISVRTVVRLVEREELIPAAEVPGGARGRAYAFLFDPRDVELVKLRREAARQEASA